MAEYIDREKVLRLIDDIGRCPINNPAIILSRELQWIRPSDVQPVKHGHWICESLGFGTYRYKCSECGNIYGQDQIEEFKHSKFCGDCGAKMDTE